jgi:hypothetical protein
VVEALEERRLLAAFSINDVQVTEGQNATVNVNFSVSLDQPVSQAVSITAAAANATAQRLVVTRLVSGLANPLFVTAAPGDNDRLFIVEQGSGGTARIRIYKQTTGALNATAFLTVSGRACSGWRSIRTMRLTASSTST